MRVGVCVRVCVFPSLSVCVTLMDAPMERRTDAWADLTAGGGGAARTVAERSRAETTSFCGRRLTIAAEGLLRFDARKLEDFTKSAFSFLSFYWPKSDKVQQHIWLRGRREEKRVRAKKEWRSEEGGRDSLWQLTHTFLDLLFSPQKPYIHWSGDRRLKTQEKISASLQKEKKTSSIRK